MPFVLSIICFSNWWTRPILCSRHQAAELCNLVFRSETHSKPMRECKFIHKSPVVLQLCYLGDKVGNISHIKIDAATVAWILPITGREFITHLSISLRELSKGSNKVIYLCIYQYYQYYYYYISVLEHCWW